MQANLELSVAKDNLKLLMLLSLPLNYQDFRHAGQRCRRLQEPVKHRGLHGGYSGPESRGNR